MKSSGHVSKPVCMASSSTGQRALKVSWIRRLWVTYAVLCFLALPQRGTATKSRCGRELLADLEFVCGDRGYYRGSKPLDRQVLSLPVIAGNAQGYGRRLRGKGIVEQCCLRGCDLQHLESYCAKPQRSRRSAPSVEPHSQEGKLREIFRKHVLAPSRNLESIRLNKVVALGNRNLPEPGAATSVPRISRHSFLLKEISRKDVERQP
ncbi:insulin-like growth factor 3 isoform X1 [Lepisosteus oculatus]|uniref:insulin-like growth factor 3 isoform X1 n=1 Tax=Lepisosteus oculatus TaxID=7918 RepID=UPI003721B50B